MIAIPKKLRQAIRLRRRAIERLQERCYFVGPRGVVQLSQRVSDLNRYIQQREWLRDPDFDPIAMGC